ncbi:MAG TPA: FG-GAP-like repeat-containing protein [Rhodothermales bacterium]|nr:FG-GAP-like repeat-containing protein [Rhodothermales bacterium]
MWLFRPFVAARTLLVLSLWLLVSVVPVAAQPFNFTYIENDLEFSYGGLGYADVDRDGHFDLVIGGNTSGVAPYRPTSFVAKSLPQEVRSGQPYQAFERTNLTTTFWHNTVGWTDFDGDGDLDFLMTGTTRPEVPFDAATRLYRNNGAGQFQESQPGIVDVYGSALDWGDYDNDGDADLLLTGTRADETRHTELYRNNGDGTFASVENTLPDVSYGAVAWGDYDNDSDLDLVLSGIDPSGVYVASIYRNDGAGSFADIQAGLEPVAFGSVDWGDYDNDGDLDLLLTGGQLSLDLLTGVLRLYRNDGSRFTAVDTGIDGIVDGAARWADYDSDGDLDMVMTGSKVLTASPRGRIYRNDEGTFVHNINLANMYAAQAVWGDDDSDGDLDLVMMGLDSRERLTTLLYRNEERVPNAPPTAPNELQATAQGTSVNLAWTGLPDDHTPVVALTYNLRVGTSPGAADVVSPMALPTGRRLLSDRGNVDHNTRWTLRNLPAGTYYWSVQAIDHGFLGSAFAEEGTFTATGSNSDQSTATEGISELPTRFAIHAAYPNPFQITTTIGYDVPEPVHITMKVYNVLGAEVATLVDQMQPPGRQQVSWDGQSGQGRFLSAGVYFVRMEAGGARWGQKVILIK